MKFVLNNIIDIRNFYWPTACYKMLVCCRFQWISLSPGSDPKTRSQQLTMLESAVEIPLYKEDLEYIDRQGVPVVTVYNGREHFVPSTIMSQVECNKWRLSILVKFAKASLDVIDDVDSNFVSPKVPVHLTNMKEQFLTTIALCSEEASPAKQ